MKNRLRKTAVILWLIVLVSCCALLFTGCQSVDKKDSYLSVDDILRQFDYNQAENKTKIEWYGSLSNETIYDFNGFSVSFRLYNGSEVLEDITVSYERGVDHGDKYSGYFNFTYDGRVDGIEYISWTADCESFWETYEVWLITVIVLLGVLLLAYVIVMIVQDLELDEVGEFISSHLWILSILIAPFIGVIVGAVYSEWVVIAIIIGAVIALIVSVLIAHLIKYVIENISFARFRAENYGDHYDGDIFDNQAEDVADYVDREDKLSLFTLSQLREYCRDNNIRGYSSMRKQQIIALIMGNALTEKSDDNKTECTKINEKAVNKSKPVKNGNEHKIMFDDIAGLEEAKTAFREKIVLAFRHRELYEKYGKKAGGGILLYGLPGTGKTMFAEAASNETDALFIPVKCSDIKSKWYGESEANVKKIFDKARKAGNAIIFFDEFEAIGAKRTDSSDNGNNDLVPQILAEMQGIGSYGGKGTIVVIAATNKPWAIDSAFLRPGRFDEKIYIPLPDFEARKRLFELKLKNVPQEKIDYDYLAGITENFSGADIHAFCDKLKMNAINESIKTNIDCPITMKTVEEVKQTVKSSVSTEDIEKLSEFREQFV